MMNIQIPIGTAAVVFTTGVAMFLKMSVKSGTASRLHRKQPYTNGLTTWPPLSIGNKMAARFPNDVNLILSLAAIFGLIFVVGKVVYWVLKALGWL